MKIYAILAAMLAIIGAGWGLYHMGGAGCREASATAAREYIERQNVLLGELENAKQIREVVYRDKVRIVRESTDACTDLPIPDAIRLQLSGNSKAKPTPNP